MLMHWLVSLVRRCAGLAPEEAIVEEKEGGIGTEVVCGGLPELHGMTREERAALVAPEHVLQSALDLVRGVARRLANDGPGCAADDSWIALLDCGEEVSDMALQVPGRAEMDMNQRLTIIAAALRRTSADALLHVHDGAIATADSDDGWRELEQLVRQDADLRDRSEHAVVGILFTAAGVLTVGIPYVDGEPGMRAVIIPGGPVTMLNVLLAQQRELSAVEVPALGDA